MLEIIKNFLVVLVVATQYGQSLSPKTGWERAIKKARAALVPLAPWSRARAMKWLT